MATVKRWLRAKQDRWLGGVCGGLGEYLGVDANVIRLIWVAVTLLSMGLGIVAYLAAWLILPEAPGKRR